MRLAVKVVLLVSCGFFVLKSAMSCPFGGLASDPEEQPCSIAPDIMGDCLGHDGSSGDPDTGDVRGCELLREKLDATRTVPDELMRLNAFVDLLRNMDPDFYPECAAWVLSLPDGVPEGMERDAHWKQLLILWGQRDYEVALRFVMDPSKRKSLYPGALADVVHDRADRDIEALLGELSRIAEEKLIPEQMNSLAPLLFSRAPEQAEAFHDEALFASALAHAASYLAGHDLSAASEVVRDGAVDNPSGACQAVLRIATEFSFSDPDAGIEWIESLNNSTLRQKAFERLFEDMSSEAPLLCVRKLLELPNSPDLNSAYSVCAFRLMKIYPDVAEDYICAIENEQVRDVFLGVLHQRMLAGVVE